MKSCRSGYRIATPGLPKLRSLADFAATHGDSFHRIGSVAQMEDGVLRVLDVIDPNVREAVKECEDIKALCLNGSASTHWERHLRPARRVVQQVTNANLGYDLQSHR